MILLKNVSKSYRNGVHALRDINLEIEEGEFVYIIGPTGCGKSTLIKLLDGEELPDQGEVYVAEPTWGSCVTPAYPSTAAISEWCFRISGCFRR